LRQVGGFLRFPPPIKLTTTILTEILLKVVLNTITLTIESDELTFYTTCQKYMAELADNRNLNQLFCQLCHIKGENIKG
jgi:hypothetical protein